MHYRPRRNKTFGYVVGVIVVIFIASGIFLTVASRIALDTANPILKIAHNVSDRTENLFSRIWYGTTESENRKILQDYKKALDILTVEQELLLSENEMLRRELGLRKTDVLGDISASILSYPPITPFDIILVDVGSTDGVAPGDTVFAGDKILIGTIKEVSANTSFISLFSTPERKTEGLLARTETAIVLGGIGNGSFEFTAPEGFDIQIGDLVVTPGSERRALGRVIAIEKEVNGTFSTIFIEQPINIKDIQWVRINKKKI